jgi:hypothetical protein
MPALTRYVLPALAVTMTAASAQIPRPEGPVQHHGQVGFIAPDGWTVQQNPNGATVMTHPMSPDQQPCQIMMLTPMPVQGDLATMGASLVRGFADANRLGPYHDSNGRDVRQSREEGVSGTGWSYVDLDGQMGQSNITARVLMIDMGGGQVLPIVGFSKHYLCLGSPFTRDNDVWALLFHSLQIPGFTQESPTLAQQIVGMWTSVGGNAGNSEIFAPNGHFSTVSMYRSYVSSSTPGYVWEVDKSWAGDGPYEVHGDRVHTTNPKGSDTERDVTRYFSVVRMPNENKPGGYDYVLRMVERSWNGSPTWGFSNSGNFVTHMVKASGH